MSTVRINDEELTIEPGEVLLDVARRNASHIGFVCDGNGLCQMCECLVLKGSEQLSPPTHEEKVWLTEEQLAEGRRLCCQTSIRGPGPVEVLTRAEELRRQADDILNPPAGTNIVGNAVRFIQSLIKINVEHVRKFPGNTIFAMTNFLSARATLETELRVLNDSWRITSGLLTGKKSSFPLLDDHSKPVALLPFSTQTVDGGETEAPPLSVTPKVVTHEPPKPSPKPVSPVSEVKPAVPAATKPAPVAEAPKPAVPAATKPAPVAEAPKPAVPTATKPAPVAEAPKPIAEAPKPAAPAETKPAPVAEAPKPAAPTETKPAVPAPKPAEGAVPQPAEKEKPASAAPKSAPAIETTATTSGSAGASSGAKPAASSSPSQSTSAPEEDRPSVTTTSSGSKPTTQTTASIAPSRTPAEDKSSESVQKADTTTRPKTGSKRKPFRRK